MKLSRPLTEKKTKTEIYSKYAARNKFVPTLCRRFKGSRPKKISGKLGILSQRGGGG